MRRRWRSRWRRARRPRKPRCRPPAPASPSGRSGAARSPAAAGLVARWRGPEHRAPRRRAPGGSQPIPPAQDRTAPRLQHKLSFGVPEQQAAVGAAEAERVAHYSVDAAAAALHEVVAPEAGIDRPRIRTARHESVPDAQRREYRLDDPRGPEGMAGGSLG